VKITTTSVITQSSIGRRVQHDRISCFCSLFHNIVSLLADYDEAELAVLFLQTNGMILDELNWQRQSSHTECASVTLRINESSFMDTGGIASL